MEDTGKIKVLPTELANLIAAGEVVEKPASVVKELVENSIDAGATAITVEIREGGTSFIRVTDNGKGISPREMETAFLRHATSKLSKAEDLEEIFTLGFRGEALAAIAAVSKIKLTSCQEGEMFAHLLVLEGGKVVEKEEVGGAKGTTIQVSDLFFNTPARKKFMKTHRGEGGAITSLMQVIAMSHPEISFQYIRDGKKDMTTSGDSVLKNALFSVMGKDIALGLRPVSFSDLTTKVEGFVSLPSCCRPSRNYQHFFINGRYVKSGMLCKALEKAYENQKMVGKFPAAVLHLTIDFRDVDVNVHPAKTQVKFAREEELFRILFHGIKNALLGHKDIQRVILSDNNTADDAPVAGEIQVGVVGNQLQSVVSKNLITDSITTNDALEDTSDEVKTPEKEVQSAGLNQTKSENFQPPPPVPSVDSARKVTFHRFSYRAGSSMPPMNYQVEDTDTSKEVAVVCKKQEDIPKDTYKLPQNVLEYDLVDGKKEKVSMHLPRRQRVDWKKSGQSSEEEEWYPDKSRKKTENSTEKVEISLKITENIPDTSLEPVEEHVLSSVRPSKTGEWRVVGEFFRTYVAVEMDDEIFFIDKHAAHERINFNRLKSQNYRPMSQTLLTPVLVNLSPEEMACVFSHEHLWEEFSFEMEEFSAKAILVTRCPHDIPENRVEETFLELVEGLLLGDFPDPDAMRDHLLHTIACKSAIKAGYITEKEELRAIGELAMEDKVRHCPHGRPILAALSKKDLEKRFKRI